MTRRVREQAKKCAKHIVGRRRQHRDDPSFPIQLKSALIEESAIERGYTCHRLSPYVLMVEMAGCRMMFDQMNGPLSSFAGKMLCDRKHMARSLLAAEGFRVPRSRVLWSRYGCQGMDESAATEFVEQTGCPVVVKPLDSARGRGVTTHIQDLRAFRGAVKLARTESRAVLVEEQFDGEDFRLFVVDGRVISATHRARANVVGDGKHTIHDLIKEKNHIRRQNRYLCGHPIPTDVASLSRMHREGLSIRNVPAKGERVVLRDQSNLSGGGDSIDVTDECHPDFKEIATRAISSIPGMRYAGVDILAHDIRGCPAADNHVIVEVEFSPAPIAHFPLVGKSRDMAGAILDFYAQGDSNAVSLGPTSPKAYDGT